MRRAPSGSVRVTHESRFSLEGVVKGGAAKKNLLVPVTRVEGESLVVELDRVRS